jgi:hypothetical protein
VHAGSEWRDENVVFAQPNGRPIDKKTNYDDWTRLLQSAGSVTSACTTAGTPPRPYC